MSIHQGEEVTKVDDPFDRESFHDFLRRTDQVFSPASTDGSPQTEVSVSEVPLTTPPDASSTTDPQTESNTSPVATNTTEGGRLTRRRNKVVAAMGAVTAVASLAVGLGELNGSSSGHQPRVSIADQLNKQSRYNPAAFTLTWLKATLKGDARDTEPYISSTYRKSVMSPNGTDSYKAIVDDFDGKFAASDQHPQIANPAALASFNPATAAPHTGPAVVIKGMSSFGETKTVTLELGANNGQAEIEGFLYNANS